MTRMAILPLATAAFVSTNLDDLFVLLSLFADVSFRPAEIVVGQYLGMGAITLLALLGSLAAVTLSDAWVGLLGLLPLGIGLRRLVRRPDGVAHPARAGGGAAVGRVLASAAITTANGGDNVAVYVPVLHGRSWDEVAMAVAVFGIMTAAWCVLAWAMVSHPRVRRPVRRLGQRALPWIYMGVGGYILLASRADAVLGLGR